MTRGEEGPARLSGAVTDGDVLLRGTATIGAALGRDVQPVEDEGGGGVRRTHSGVSGQRVGEVEAVVSRHSDSESDTTTERATTTQILFWTQKYKKNVMI